MQDQRNVTELLLSLREGDPRLLSELLPLVHAELKRIARAKLRRERKDHTLNPTALVNEAYLKLVRVEDLRYESRVQFLALAAQAMRNILVSHARYRKRQKRGGGALHISLSNAENLPALEADRIVELHEALEELETLNARHARIVECRFFGGMTIEETATALGISPATAKRDWTLLRAWLVRRLEAQP